MRMVLMLGTQPVLAKCSDITASKLNSAISTASSKNAVKSQGGYGLKMWITVVDESGKICEVTTNGATGALAGNSEWLGSRVISAQKAFTANAFSLDGYAISTANLYAAVQPGGSLFGLQHSNPVDATLAYSGSPSAYGTKSDPLVGKRIGGVNVFGGGLALYSGGKKIGAIGVSGDTSCRDHAFVWQIRENLGFVPGGTGITTSNYDAAGANPTPLSGATRGDELILQSGSSSYWEAWAQPACPNSAVAVGAASGTLQDK
ncbi:heme-binding protein [Methylomonas paludis]|uniref:Heme-binding protein n=1 Tax=Methylomonas paludis TaxID=1173101 RepID=A0A975MPS3_9GAMM|nr:heme-binding protein [Methylomonas paludis]QWF71737.1 heme-binding protein [Methylomonas paludis]